MQVIDHQPHTWFLFQQKNDLLLDVNCGQSAVGYSVLIRLSAEEVATYGQEGAAYLDQLAERVHRSGPGSTHQLRDISAQYSGECTAAIESWRKERNST